MPSSNLEQLTLELINDARLNPLGDAMRYILSYSPLTASQANIQNNLDFFGVNGNALLSAFTALVTARPLAFNDILAGTARAHDSVMIAANIQSHQLPGELSFDVRITNAGYSWTNVAENIFSAAQDALQAQAAFMVDWGGPDNGMQSPPGHRNNIMGSQFREVGIGVVSTPIQSNVGPLVITEDFGAHSSTGVFILGVAYNDTDHNNFYSLGEGLGTLNVAVGAANAASAASGGYALQTNATGSQAITFTGGGLSSAVTFTTTLTNGENAKIDIIDGNTLTTSVSGAVSGPIGTVRALGLTGLSLSSGAGAQTLIGTPGNDTLGGGGGNDSIQGVGGDDTAVFSGNHSQYTIVKSGGSFIVTDTVAARDGVDTLTDVEHAQFSDTTVSLTSLISSFNDLYITKAGTPITVPGVSGVLANDSDIDALPLTAALGTTTSHGALTFNANGSFSYTPNAGFVGTDSFSYTASDGTLTGPATTASIVVGAIEALALPDQQIGELYVGYYNRAPDPGGMNFWVSAFTTPPINSPGGINDFYNNLPKAADSFADPGQAETIALYPFLADPQHATYADVVHFVQAAYSNLFNRSTDPAGEAYWSSAIAKSLGIPVPTFNDPVLDHTSALPASRALIAFIFGALDTDAQTVANKVIAGNYYKHYLEDTGVDATAASAHAAFSGVTFDPATVLASEAVTNAFVQSVLHEAVAPLAAVGLADQAPASGW